MRKEKQAGFPGGETVDRFLASDSWKMKGSAWDNGGDSDTVRRET